MHEPRTEPFSCDVEHGRDRTRVIPRGEVDIASVPTIESHLRELREAGCDCLLLDLSAATFIDSTGLRLLVAWDTSTRTEGVEFGLVPGSPEVQRLFELTGLVDRLPFVDGRP